MVRIGGQEWVCHPLVSVAHCLRIPHTLFCLLLLYRVGLSISIFKGEEIDGFSRLHSQKQGQDSNHLVFDLKPFHSPRELVSPLASK